MRVILTGFGPFPGVPFNPSAALVKALARRRRPAFTDIERITHVFATTYDSVDRDLPKLFARQPDIVLMFGLAGERRQLCIETRARNALSLLSPDASGHRARHGVIVPGGPTSRRGAAPFADLVGAVRPSRFPTRLSRDAGRYLCNYSYWRGLEQSRQRRALVQFVHIPRVRSSSRRVRRPGRRRASFSHLVNAAELLLIGLVAASRRQWPAKPEWRR
jgi:pyroglutamyl-peptidase